MNPDEILDEKTNKLFLQKVKIDLDNANNRLLSVQLAQEIIKTSLDKKINYDFSEFKYQLPEPKMKLEKHKLLKELYSNKWV
jgi:hypothetical protein